MRLTILLIGGIWLIGMTGFFFLIRNIHDDVERQYAQAAEEPMVDMAQFFAALVEAHLSPEGEIDTAPLRELFDNALAREFEAQIYSQTKNRISTGVYVTNADGTVLFHSIEPDEAGKDYSDFNDVFRTLRGEYGARSTRADPDDSLSSTFYVGAPVRWNGEIAGVVSVARPESTMRGFVEETRQVVLRAGWIATISVVIVAGLWAYLLLRPAGLLTGYARAVEKGRRQPLPKSLGFAEFRTLGHALERMRVSLEGKADAEAYVQTMTHELKSPLAAIAGAAELLREADVPPGQRQRFLENIEAETQRCQDLVRRLLQLAAIEKLPALDSTETVHLETLVQGEIDRLQPMATTRNLRFEFRPAAGVPPVRGDAFTLETAVRNLLSNAIDYAPEHSAVEVTLERHGDGVNLSVRDHGPGIPDYAIDRVFERFYSLKHEVTGRKSSGLGLCFVKEAADLHNGSITLENESPKGLKATFHLPLSDHTARGSGRSRPHPSFW